MEKIFSTNINTNLTLWQNEIFSLLESKKFLKIKIKLKILDKAVSDQVKQDFKALLLRDLINI